MLQLIERERRVAGARGLDLTAPLDPSFTIRRAEPAEAETIAATEIACMRESYRGVVPDSHLDSLSLEKRAQLWSKRLSARAPHAGAAVFVARNAHADIVGIAACGDQRTHGMQHIFPAEIYALFARQAFKGRGVGKRLMQSMVYELQARGETSAMLWGLRDSHDVGFFQERLGGAILDRGFDNAGPQPLPATAYAWPDLSTLLKTPKHRWVKPLENVIAKRRRVRAPKLLEAQGHVSE